MTMAQDAALAPVRAYMLRRAQDQADDMLTRARHEAEAITSAARDSAEAAVSQARAAGRREAAALAEAERARGRAEARAALLAARQEALNDLRARVSAEIAALRAEPGYDRLLDGLTRAARAAAGPDALLAFPPDGGVIARSPTAVVDCSLPRLAELAVQALGPAVQELWVR
jgi:vacuolar-type H+-ATPase subunit E/Vma4